MVQVSYPGVYIQEIPSGVRTITGVATSITAFIGRALSGLVDTPVSVTSWSDYERQFGGLWEFSTMSYAVRDFFANQGSQAIIIRVAHSDAHTATLTFGDSPATDLVLEAASPGDWGNRITATVNHGTDDTLPRTSPPSTDPERFNLLVEYRVAPDREERVQEPFLNVSLDESNPRYLRRVLESQSQLVRVRSHMAATSPPARPDVQTGQGQGGTDGTDITDNDIIGSPSARTGLYALNKADLFNLLCIPPPIRVTPENVGAAGTFTSANVYGQALPLCVTRRAFLIVDPDPAWAATAPSPQAVTNAVQGQQDLGLTGPDARNAALYFPAIRGVDPLKDNQVYTFAPCGVIAGIMARTDSTRGVWKAPAGLDAALGGVQGLQVNLNDQENGTLNQLGINCLRSFPVTGRVVWGARTVRGADQLADEYKYVPVRRLALFIEESLYRGTQWVVFEPNDEPLWAQIRLNIGAFMQNLFRQGAFQGKSPREAYLVKCDAETTTQNDINLGIVNILVGFAPLKPAEFVIIRIQQLAGQVQT
jgi:phage tail sheath protein FI